MKQMLVRYKLLSARCTKVHRWCQKAPWWTFQLVSLLSIWIWMNHECLVRQFSLYTML